MKDAPFLKRKKTEQKKDDKKEETKKKTIDKEDEKDEGPKFHNCFVHMGKLQFIVFECSSKNKTQ